MVEDVISSSIVTESNQMKKDQDKQKSYFEHQKLCILNHPSFNAQHENLQQFNVVFAKKIQGQN